ncbi:site-specific DNA-methyltransferase [Acinetobacter portensis]|uniref:site-specific DNA-methyltransferase (adenine-specific) n=1 Tax=Acinetobacter portensis TaxID=1839785 RepID=A0ABY4K0G3_9GAMM|nr:MULTISPECIES: site-specific DNA-methyltransferase [Acinetobacter]MCK7610269.1 site-specific DNA-methyltransferase [Acinetobacter portensis]MCK7641044.1 site-specific DNA-methyltransferase [Acinetobacter portensis]NHB66995.1 site-specific DNA-methyltransferase [Acinetobacter sp. GFQ9D191M]NHC00720.1 site-specific DNA-methyltransferase [Acinetobacter sp. GFQ9D192M]UPO24691.1 site-specific DNA-methyltransferase [Acinetobacter portensis]
MDKLKMHSPNLVDSNIEKIAALFPNCVTEAQGENGELKKAIDFDLLKQELSQILVEGEQERYRLDWVGKKEAILTANAPIAKTLRPCREESVNFDRTENLFIEGDNLEALKLLQENYLGKVKMIYIDPPYNTGNDFIYEDDFAESTDAFFEKSNQVDEEGNRLIANTDSNGRFHSDWLSMMYSRLKLARNLLSDEGVIYLSIDDNEVHNLRKVCDEIFGSSNFISQISVVNNIAGRSDRKHIATAHEYVLMYQKSVKFNSTGLPLSDEQKSEYKFEDEKGRYRLQGLRKRGSGALRIDRPNMYYPVYYSELNNTISLDPIDENSIVITPKLSDGQDGRWRWGKDTFNKKKDFLLAKQVSGRNEFDLFEKVYLGLDGNEKSTKLKSFILEKDCTSDNASSNLRALFDGIKPFDTPKPLKLIELLLTISNLEDNDVVLDFFCGSGTLAHAVLNYNYGNSLKLKNILVQLPELVEESSDAYKGGYKTIADVSKDRIRRAGQKILTENEEKEDIENLDIGFRVLKIDSTNMKDVYYTPDALKQADMLDLASNIKEDRTSEDLLFQVMLDWGLELSLPIERKTIAGKEVFYVAGNSLVACFDDLTFEVVDEVAKDHPLRFVSAEKAIHLDHDKTNIKERFKQLSPDTEVKFL